MMPDECFSSQSLCASAVQSDTYSSDQCQRSAGDGGGCSGLGRGEKYFTRLVSAFTDTRYTSLTACYRIICLSVSPSTCF